MVVKVLVLLFGHKCYFLSLVQHGPTWRWTWRTGWRCWGDRWRRSPATLYQPKESAVWPSSGFTWVEPDTHVHTGDNGDAPVLNPYESLGESTRCEAENLLPELHFEVLGIQNTIHRSDQREWYWSHWNGGADHQRCTGGGRGGVYLYRQKSDGRNWRGTYKPEGFW